jgi:hypothetical protein
MFVAAIAPDLVRQPMDGERGFARVAAAMGGRDGKQGGRSAIAIASALVGAALVVAVVVQEGRGPVATLSADARGTWMRDHSADPSTPAPIQRRAHSPPHAAACSTARVHAPRLRPCCCAAPTADAPWSAQTSRSSRRSRR